MRTYQITVPEDKFDLIRKSLDIYAESLGFRMTCQNYAARSIFEMRESGLDDPVISVDLRKGKLKLNMRIKAPDTIKESEIRSLVQNVLIGYERNYNGRSRR